ncbi:AraC family transcriptional regulator [Treponema sp. R8-4-B8]
MSGLNLIQRRELDPLLIKANRIVKHYEKASNCRACVMEPESIDHNLICSHCSQRARADIKEKCAYLHTEAVNKARQFGGSYIYICLKKLVFWTSPFYSGERLAGALFSGGIEESEKNNDKVQALAQIMLLCANHLSRFNPIQKNIVSINTDNIETSSTTQQKQNIEKYACQLDTERMLLACLRRGDKEEGQKILVKLLNIIYQEVRGNFQAFRLKALELAVLLSRAVSDPKDITDNTSLENTNRCMKKIEECTTFDGIKEILSTITDKMSGMIFSFHGVRHFSALKKAESYIWKHYTRKLSLKEIANASGLSAPYLSMIFKEEMGENLSNYLNRLRVEKAAGMLVTTNLPINEITFACGFEDQSWFSKIFKNFTGLTPGKYRERGIIADGNIMG